MSIDQLPGDFAPLHLVAIRPEIVQCLGLYYSLRLALADLAAMRRRFPETTFGVLSDCGLIEETPTLKILRSAA